MTYAEVLARVAGPEFVAEGWRLARSLRFAFALNVASVVLAFAASLTYASCDQAFFCALWWTYGTWYTLCAVDNWWRWREHVRLVRRLEAVSVGPT